MLVLTGLIVGLPVVLCNLCGARSQPDYRKV